MSVLELLRAGHEAKDIRKLPSRHPKTAYHIIETFRKQGTSERKLVGLAVVMWLSVVVK